MFFNNKEIPGRSSPVGDFWCCNGTDCLVFSPFYSVTKGYYLNKGDRLTFELTQAEYTDDGTGYPVNGHVELYIYQYNENTGKFVLSQTIVSPYDSGYVSEEIYFGSVPSSGYYAFGTRNFNLSPLYFRGFLYK